MLEGSLSEKGKKAGGGWGTNRRVMQRHRLLGRIGQGRARGDRYSPADASVLVVDSAILVVFVDGVDVAARNSFFLSYRIRRASNSTTWKKNTFLRRAGEPSWKERNIRRMQEGLIVRLEPITGLKLQGRLPRSPVP